jgi:hypothetical protein
LPAPVYTCKIRDVTAQASVREQVLEAAIRIADSRRTFRLKDVVAALPHLNAGTVRTHVASRCCANAPAHHQVRWPYFRSLGRGVYRIEAAAARRKIPMLRERRRGWQDRVLEGRDSGIDPTLITASVRLTPTERLERMRRAAVSLREMRMSARRVRPRRS